ncbi:MAG TPA: hypothetical protein PKL08_00810 [Thermoanaerobaculaceae bacterium]|nr:hypothetical protein [Thermoanaerobaculaceae bacterium]
MSTAVLGQAVLGQLVLGNTTTSGPSGLPAWAPSLAQVGARIPTRTREVGVDNGYSGSFTTETYPTAAQVTILLTDTCDLLAAKVGTPIMPAAYAALRVAATLRTAWACEIAYPERDADVTVYEGLLVEADAALEAAADANRAAGGGTDLDSAGEVVTLVSFGFPDPPPYADWQYL